MFKMSVSPENKEDNKLTSNFRCGVCVCTVLSCAVLAAITLCRLFCYSFVSFSLAHKQAQKVIYRLLMCHANVYLKEVEGKGTAFNQYMTMYRDFESMQHSPMTNSTSTLSNGL